MDCNFRSKFFDRVFLLSMRCVSPMRAVRGFAMKMHIMKNKAPHNSEKEIGVQPKILGKGSYGIKCSHFLSRLLGIDVPGPFLPNAS